MCANVGHMFLYWRVTVICLAKFFMNSNKIRNAFNIHVREMTEAMENRGRCSSCGRLLLLLSLALSLSSINANCDLQKKYKYTERERDGE